MYTQYEPHCGPLFYLTGFAVRFGYSIQIIENIIQVAFEIITTLESPSVT